MLAKRILVLRPFLGDNFLRLGSNLGAAGKINSRRRKSVSRTYGWF